MLLSKQNLMTKLRAARAARPSEKSVPVSTKLVDEFLGLVALKEKDDTVAAEAAEKDIAALRSENEALRAEINKLKAELTRKTVVISA
jgi:cell division protein FtsB